MHATQQAFLADICREPERDDLRLIFADWLEDEEQAERAEFIRLQCEIATWGNLSFEVARKASKLIERWQKRAPVQMHGRTPACKLLREHVLLSDPHNFCSWVPLFVHQGSGVGIRCVKPPLLEITGGWCKSVEFTRGFPSHVTLSEADFLQHCEAIFRAAPITSVTLSDVGIVGPIEQGPQTGDYFFCRRDVSEELWALIADPSEHAVTSHAESREKCLDRLSRFAVLLGRQRAALPPLGA